MTSVTLYDPHMCGACGSPLVECVAPGCHELTCRAEAAPVDPSMDPELRGGHWCSQCVPHFYEDDGDIDG